MEATNNDTFDYLLRDGVKITAVRTSILQADIDCYPDPASCCLSVPVHSPFLQGTAMSIATEIPTQASHVTRSFESAAGVHDGSHFSDSMLSPVNPPSHLHASPQYPSLTMLTIEPQPEVQQLILHIQQLRMQLLLKDQQIQGLRCRLAYLRQYHARQLVVPEIGHPLQHQLLSQQFVPMDSGLRSSRQSWVSEDLSSTIQTENNREQSLQDHRLSTIQNIVPEATGCDRHEAECQDRGEIRSKAEAKRPQWRLTDEQSRNIISRREGEEPASYRTIAKFIGCSKSTAWRHKRKHLCQKSMIQKEDL
ncbi:MAG: hypothetical protein J3Q66DRAFT_386399 [Benniella sp.]|nr:MAG: hypothetical protein J3Q66DRAFT_386399 [Benniella sp.]